MDDSNGRDRRETVVGAQGVASPNGHAPDGTDSDADAQSPECGASMVKSEGVTHPPLPTVDGDRPIPLQDGRDARYGAISDASPLGMLVSDEKGVCVYANRAYEMISGQSAGETCGGHWADLIRPTDRHRIVAECKAAIRASRPYVCDVQIVRSDGTELWVHLNVAAMAAAQGRGEWVHVFEDISQRKTEDRRLEVAEELLYAEKERAQVTLNSIGDAVVTTDLAGRITYLNQVAEKMTGWGREEAQDRPLAEVFRIIDGTTRRTVSNPAQRAINQDKVMGLSADCVLIRRDGEEFAIEDSAAPIHDRHGRVAGAVMVFHDASQSRSMAQKMAHLAQHDFLTNLPNRMLLTERLTQAMALAKRNRRKLALLFLDLDHFKHINDSLGHVVGDQLLKSVAERLTGCVRVTDTVCRQGGDEFVILLSEVDGAQDAALVAEKLGKAFLAPHMIGERDLHVTLSMGISVYPDDGLDVDTIMQCADTAMYHAKAIGRNNHQFFSSDMNARAVRRLYTENSLRRALRQGEFLLCYQPKIDLVSGKLTGAEALIRWLDPALGLIYPNSFVSIAEESGLIVNIGRWVVHEACRQTRAWLDADLEAVPVAVNISAVEFRHKDFLGEIARILKETGLPPSYLELELTESTLMREGEPSAELLDGLKALGVRLAIDDFGTGYSSLSYLKRFPIDTLKIDQSLVRDIVSDPDGATIVGAVIEMGRNLNQKVVAEGIETPEQLAMLIAQHCDEGQGYQFSHPLSAVGMARMLESGVTPEQVVVPL